jgi:hypothetical protein
VIAGLLRKVIPKRFRPIGYIEHLVETHTGRRVAAGPFAGMRYIRGAVGSAYVPKLLGIYERELQPFVEQGCALNYPLIIDIGSAEGYYAIGLAIRNPTARVIAFEASRKGQDALREMAQSNQVSERVDIRGTCDPGALQEALAGEERMLIICDVEGFEQQLLDPEQIIALRKAAILVELHEFISPGITERLKDRFAPTHAIETILQADRGRQQMPWRTLATTLLPRSYLDWAVSEWRPEKMAWLWLTPKSANVPG